MLIPISDENTYLGRPIFNYSLIGLNVLLFVILNLMIRDEKAFLAAAFVPKDFGVFTLFASVFVHAGLFHIVSNMLFLWITGDNVEIAFGGVLYLAFYLVCGILAGAFHGIMNLGSSVPVVGASGAISGVLGAYLVLHPDNKIRFWYWLYYFWFGTFQVKAKFAIGAYFVLQLIYLSLAGPDSRISYEAHIGGGLSGVGLAILFLRLGWAKRERPHAWILPPSSSRLPRVGRSGERDPSPLPSRVRKAPPLLPRVPRRVRLRGATRSTRGLQFLDPQAWTVIRENESPLDALRAGEIISEEIGCPKVDITSLISSSKGFLTREVDREEADRLVILLKEAGIHALAVPCKDLQQLPRAILLRGVRVHANGLDTRTEWEEFSILWNEIRLVSCGRIRTEKTIRKMRASANRPRLSSYGAYPMSLPLPRGGGASFEKVRRDEIVIDLFHTDPKLRFRFWEGRFRFDEADGPTTPDHMTHLARRIAENSSGPYISPGLTALAQGKDLADYSFGNRAAFENYNRYLFLLERNAPEVLRGGRARWLEL